MPRGSEVEGEEATTTEHWSTDNQISLFFWKFWYVYSFCQTLLRNLQLLEVQLKEVTNENKRMLIKILSLTNKNKNSSSFKLIALISVHSLLLQMLISRRLYPRRDWLWSPPGRRARKPEPRTGKRSLWAIFNWELLKSKYRAIHV